MFDTMRKPLQQLRRLGGDTAGNTLIITAFLMFPMIGLIGSGIDMSRAYMVKTRLQSACDAGVLAGRKAMNDGGIYNAAAKAKADAMFKFNFNEPGQNANTTVFTHRDTTDGEVVGTATTKLPTLVMKTFGYQKFDLSVACSAELQVSNTDVMFVLDTTGSMGWPSPGDSSKSKLQALVEAVKDFHATMAAAVTNDSETRVRYGFVPYSMTVNTGKLLPQNYMADSAVYSSRVANFTTPEYKESTTDGPTKKESRTFSRSSYCSDWGENTYGGGPGSPVYISGSKPGDVVYRYFYNDTRRDYDKRSDQCDRYYFDRTTSTTLIGYGFTNWTYKQVNIDTSAIKTGNSVNYVRGTSGTIPASGSYDIFALAKVAGASGLSLSSDRWDGCIEERATVQQLNMDPVPSGAHDLNINSAPTNNATKWRPYFEPTTYWRGYGNLTSWTTTTTYSPEGVNCPAEAKQFTTVDTVSTTPPSWLNTYLNGLKAVGGTYHDIGMIWGARMASPRGIFASNVNDGALSSVGRHIIFMTDGIMDTAYDYRTAYGMEIYNNYIAPSGTSGTSLDAYHNNRFVAACKAIKNEGYIVWVVGFGTAVTDEMKTCSSDGRWYEASDLTALKNAFKTIASSIADLRLND
ncbi:MAG: hypothetical protein GW859_03265 [Sphingomonadales bacterium]|nr:hypothetical protein [Sphingomonadales bacterium]